MSALLDVILPVFLLIGAGYIAAWRGIFTDSMVDGMMRFAQNIAAPCLLFRSVATLDLGQAYDLGLLFSFYLGALGSFGLGIAGAVLLFKRPLTDAVAIGFACLFSNALLLGLPITERAYGPDAVAGNLAIISIHAPIFYTAGIALMEMAKARGHGLSVPALSAKIARAVFVQPMVIGILLGFVVNLGGVPMPGSVMATVGMLAQSAIPTALFGLGGVLLRYRPEGDAMTIGMVCFLSLVAHPAITWALATWVFHVPQAGLRSAVLTASMAPGVNAYLFANLYGVAKRVNASAVLIATALSIVTIWGWLHLLP